jgi:hypothetical protein
MLTVWIGSVWCGEGSRKPGAGKNDPPDTPLAQLLHCTILSATAENFVRGPAREAQTWTGSTPPD